MRRQAEAVDVVLRPRLGIDHEDLRRRLLDDRAADPAFKRVLRALRGEADHAVALADGLFPVLDPAHEHLVVERFPAFVDDDDRRACRRAALRPGGRNTASPACALRGIVEDRGHVEADGVRGQVGAVVLIVEQPRALAAAPPRPQARVEVVAVGRDRRETARPDSAGGGVRWLARNWPRSRRGPARFRSTVILDRASRLEPLDQELAIGRRVRQLQRIEPRGLAGRSRSYWPPIARMNSSAPRSLSKKMILGANLRAWARRKLSTTVLPEPDGPMIVKLPRS